MPTLGSLARFGGGGFMRSLIGGGSDFGIGAPPNTPKMPTSGNTGQPKVPRTRESTLLEAQNNAARMAPMTYYGAMAGQNLPGFAQGFGAAGQRYQQALDRAAQHQPRLTGAQRQLAAQGPQSGYQTTEQLLAQMAAGADVDAQGTNPAGSIMRQLISRGPDALVGADPALLARIKQAALAGYQNQIDQNMLSKQQWSPGGAYYTPGQQTVTTFDQNIARLMAQMARWA